MIYVPRSDPRLDRDALGRFVKGHKMIQRRNGRKALANGNLRPELAKEGRDALTEIGRVFASVCGKACRTPESSRLYQTGHLADTLDAERIGRAWRRGLTMPEIVQKIIDNSL